MIGIDASCTPLQTKAQILDIAQKTSELVGGKTITAEDIVLNEEYEYPVYGVPSAHLALSWARRTWEENQQGEYFPAHLRGDKKTPRTFRWSLRSDVLGTSSGR